MKNRYTIAVATMYSLLATPSVLANDNIIDLAAVHSEIGVYLASQRGQILSPEIRVNLSQTLSIQVDEQQDSASKQQVILSEDSKLKLAMTE